MKKYKLINKQTGEEHLCDKITIDGFDYYVSCTKEQVELQKCYYEHDNATSIYSFTKNTLPEQYYLPQVIATNKANIDVPKVVDEVWKIAKDYVKTLGVLGSDLDNITSENLVVWGYNKSQETHSFSEDDMIEFGDWLVDYMITEVTNLSDSTKELLQIWKEQQPKTLYYE